MVSQRTARILVVAAIMAVIASIIAIVISLNGGTRDIPVAPEEAAASDIENTAMPSASATAASDIDDTAMPSASATAVSTEEQEAVHLALEQLQSSADGLAATANSINGIELSPAFLKISGLQGEFDDLKDECGRLLDALGGLDSAIQSTNDAVSTTELNDAADKMDQCNTALIADMDEIKTAKQDRNPAAAKESLANLAQLVEDACDIVIETTDLIQ